MKDYNKILDQVYELEGLLLLALSKDEVPPQIQSLIHNKALSILPLTAPSPSPSAPSSFLSSPSPSTSSPSSPSSSPSTPSSSPSSPSSSSSPSPSLSPSSQSLSPHEASFYLPQGRKAVSTAPSSFRSHPLFSLNDRYLYIRELFNESEADFNSAMNTVATLDNYDEAEEYFLSEFNMDPGSETTSAFLKTISDYFDK